jgi:outer membrane protein
MRLAVSLSVSFLITFGVFVFDSEEARSQSSSIGVIDIQKVLRSSIAARSIRPQMEKLKANFQQRFKNSEAELLKAKQDLERERAILPEGFGERRKAFEGRVSDTQRQVQTVNRKLDRALANAMRQVHKNLREITKDLAKERSLQFVVPKRVMIFYEKRFDITQEVSRRLNKKLPKVKVVMPKTKRSLVKK